MIKRILEKQITEAISILFSSQEISIQLQKTRIEFEGDLRL